MISTSNGNGRLCNKIFRNVIMNIIAKNNNLQINYECYDEINNKMGILLYIGEKVYDKLINIEDDNFHLFIDRIDLNANIRNKNDDCYYQTQIASRYIFDYINGYSKNSIIQKNPFANRYQNNNDCFIHIRLDDAAQHNPGIDYYLQTIKLIFDRVDNIYISSDSPQHFMIQNILQTIPKTKLYEDNQNIFHILQFSSTCRYIILSHGSFSAIIGYLAFYSDSVFYPDYNRIKKFWFGDMFSIDERFTKI